MLSNLVFGSIVAVGWADRTWTRMCTLVRPGDNHGTEKLTFVFKPELKLLSLEIVSGDKSFQLLTRKEFDDENSYVPSCESVEGVLVPTEALLDGSQMGHYQPNSGPPTSLTSAPWQTWDRTSAVVELGGITRNAAEYCPPQFPFILEQSTSKVKVDCLIGDCQLPAAMCKF